MIHRHVARGRFSKVISIYVLKIGYVYIYIYVRNPSQSVPVGTSCVQNTAVVLVYLLVYTTLYIYYYGLVLLVYDKFGMYVTYEVTAAEKSVHHMRARLLPAFSLLQYFVFLRGNAPTARDGSLCHLCTMGMKFHAK